MTHLVHQAWTAKCSVWCDIGKQCRCVTLFLLVCFGVVLQICMSFEGSRAVGMKQSKVAGTVSGLSARGSEVERGSTKSK